MYQFSSPPDYRDEIKESLDSYSPDLQSQDDLRDQDLSQQTSSLPPGQLDKFHGWSGGSWDDDASDETDAIHDTSQPYPIQYTVEWKVTLNNRSRAHDTEQDVVLARYEFWETTLQPKVTAIIKKKLPSHKSYQAEGTKVIIYATNNKKVRRSFDAQNIEWPFIDNELHKREHFRDLGKTIYIVFAFNYIEIVSTETVSTYGTRRGGQHRTSSATQLMLQELDQHRDDSGGPSPWRRVASLTRCPGPPCHVGPYCVLDRTTNKRFKLRQPHISRCIRHIEEGYPFESQDDIPEDLFASLRLEDQQKMEIQSRTSAGKQGPINITNVLPGSSAGDPPIRSKPCLRDMDIVIRGPLDEAVPEYCSWLTSKFTRGDTKLEYEKIGNVSLDEGLDLDLIYEAQNPSFFVEKGIKPGVAQRFIRDIPEWAAVRYARND